MEKISTYPFVDKHDVLMTSWGKIIAKKISIEIYINGIGRIEIFGWIAAERKDKDGKVIISGTELEQPAILINGELEA